jgi:hypothetical protein
MARYVAANNATSTLQATVNDSVTTLTIADADKNLFPLVTGGDVFPVTLVNGDDREICLCSNRTDNVLTVTRGAEGSTPRAFPAGAVVGLYITAGFVNSKVDEDDIPKGPDQAVQYNDGGILAGSAALAFNKDTESLVIGQGTVLADNPLTVGADVDSYAQINFQNTNEGESASTDYVATADDGTDDNFYIDMGINSSVYADPTYSATGPHDGYVQTFGGDLVLIAGSEDHKVKVATGGTESTNLVAEFDDDGLNLLTGKTLRVAGVEVYEETANKGQANGYASLGADGKVPSGQLPATNATFLGLTDTPSAYTGQQGKLVAVNAAQTALEFITASAAGDMTAAVYDPTGVAADVFDADNHVDGTTNKVFTATEKTKLSGIAAGAEVNVNADWNAASGDAQILNKPSAFTPVSHNNTAHSEPFAISYYGTGAPPSAAGLADGTLYFKYV